MQVNLHAKFGTTVLYKSPRGSVLSIEEYGIREAYVFTNDNVKIKGKVVCLPIYMIMFLKDDVIDFADISLERFRM